MKTYRLGSSSMVYAPGIVAWAINGAAFKRDRKKLAFIGASTWSIPEGAALALITRKVPHTIEGETVVFSVGA
jgi:hypothetical protein